MTNEKATKEYGKLAIELADAINDISDARDKARYLNEQCKDNGDPAYKLDEALSYLAPALAMAISYSRDYEDEAKKFGADTEVTDQM